MRVSMIGAAAFLGALAIVFAALAQTGRRVLLLQPKAYEPIGGPVRTHHFFVAEDVQQVFPDLVGTDADGRANNIDYLGLLTKTIALVQDQQREIDELKSRDRR